MTATQHKSPGRVGDLSPFDIKVTLEPPKPSPIRKALECEIPRGAAKTDMEYGCVDWYQYRGSESGIVTSTETAFVCRHHPVPSVPSVSSNWRFYER